MKKNIFTAIAGIAITLSLCTGYTISRNTARIRQSFEVSSDTVNLKIYDETIKNDAIVPEQIINTNIYIKNEGAPCYVRWKSELIINDVLYKRLNLDDLPELDEVWIQGKDGYYYSKIPMEEYQKIDIYKKLRFSEDIIDPLKEGDSITIITTAQAIQSKNFTPNWDEEQPWHNEKIEETVRSHMEVGA